jgi:hypothetical protein
MTADCRQREECFWSLDRLGGGGFSAKILGDRSAYTQPLIQEINGDIMGP